MHNGGRFMNTYARQMYDFVSSTIFKCTWRVVSCITSQRTILPRIPVSTNGRQLGNPCGPSGRDSRTFHTRHQSNDQTIQLLKDLVQCVAVNTKEFNGRHRQQPDENLNVRERAIQQCLDFGFHVVPQLILSLR